MMQLELVQGLYQRVQEEPQVSRYEKAICDSLKRPFLTSSRTNIVDGTQTMPGLARVLYA